MGTVVDLHPRLHRRHAEDASAIARLRERMHRRLDLLRLWWSNRRTLAELEQLDDRLLRDIGVDKVDLEALRRHPFEDHLDRDWRTRHH